MEWTSLNDLREKYLSFFESKGHMRLKSFSLVPNNDKSLLLINSGMAPMKKYFTGEVTPPSKRVTTCQKCIRTPDLERVGHTARHGTYFEMLGNFSFGDYFKEQAIEWAWEFLTKVLEIPSDLLWPSVYEEDDEAYTIWRDKIGVPESHIVRLGKEDNFWEHGTGPCGPCSEIYFDRGEKYGCGSPDCKPGCDCDRYMEIWNNVFSQFNNMGDGTYTELEHKNIDTGMGLERLACVMQGVDNMFEVDTIRNILNKVCKMSGKEYGKDDNTDISIRAVTDHIRASVFMISDGIIPSNEGRGYVLRRIIRRAARHGKLIGINKPFLTELSNAVIAENKAGYPELVEKEQLIKKVISNEESNFNKTIDQGLNLLKDLIKAGGVLSGEAAFKLYDTYGFPLDLTKDILAENNMTVDEEKFRELMENQRQMARSSRKSADAESWKSDGISFDNIPATEFTGYTENKCGARVLDIVADGEHTSYAAEGTKAIIVLDKTAFYAESGGQVGQRGGGILHHIMEQGGGDALAVHAEVQHEAGHSQRVADIGLTAAAADPLVGVVGQIVSLFYHGHIVGFAAGFDGPHQLLRGHDVGPHLRGKGPLRGVGRQGRCGHGSHLRHRHGLVEMGLCRVAVLFRRSRCCGRGEDRFLSLRHPYRSSRHFRMGAAARFFFPLASPSSQNFAPPPSPAG